MNQKKRDFARLLRKEPTPTERKVWKLLRDKRCLGLKFRRQHVVEGFVVDFYCPEERLAIEVDGGIHDGKLHRDYDILRQTIIESKGITIIRIKNNEIEKHPRVVLKKIKYAINR